MILNRKRSSCASGSGYVPSYSTGFWVATTKNGSASVQALAFDRHLALLHRFQQGCLGFGWRTVDLVGKQQLGEDRTLAQPKLTGVEIIDVRAEDIGGHQVGRELNPLELGLHQQRNGFRHQGLRGTGYAFEQHMPAREQGDQHDT